MHTHLYAFMHTYHKYNRCPLCMPSYTFKYTHIYTYIHYTCQFLQTYILHNACMHKTSPLSLILIMCTSFQHSYIYIYICVCVYVYSHDNFDPSQHKVQANNLAIIYIYTYHIFIVSILWESQFDTSLDTAQANSPTTLRVYVHTFCENLNAPLNSLSIWSKLIVQPLFAEGSICGEACGACRFLDSLDCLLCMYVYMWYVCWLLDPPIYLYACMYHDVCMHSIAYV